MKKYPNITMTPKPRTENLFKLDLSESKANFVSYSELIITPEYVDPAVLGFHYEKAKTMTLDEFVDYYMISVNKYVESGFDEKKREILYPDLYIKRSVEKAINIYNNIK